MLAFMRVGGIFLAVLVIGTALSFASPHFLTANNLINVLLQAATMSIIAAGFTVVLIAGEIDLSVGSAIGLTASVAAVIIIRNEVAPAAGIAIALAIGLALGLFNGYVTVYLRMPSFVVTLATLGIAHGAGLLLTAGRPIAGFTSWYPLIGQGAVEGVPVPVIIAAVVYLVIHFLLRKTSFGVQLYAIGGNREAAQLAGVRVARVIVMAFVISGFCGALAGTVLSSRLDSGHGNFGAGDLLDAVAAVVVGGAALTGGAGTVIGTLGGVLVISVIRNGLILLNVQSFWQEIAVGAIIILAVAINQAAKGELPIAEQLSRLLRRPDGARITSPASRRSARTPPPPQ
jgi:ribose transport system permease protein